MKFSITDFFIFCAVEIHIEKTMGLDIVGEGARKFDRENRDW